MTEEVVPDKKKITAWAMYDWANSVYPLVINSTIFPIYYESITSRRDAAGKILHDDVIFMGMELPNMALYSYALSMSYLLVAIVNPLLSGVADYTGNKKMFLRFFCYLGAGSCLLLPTYHGGNTEWGMLLILLASVGFSGGLVFYNGFLPEIAPRRLHDSVSAKGFAYGYAGSVILLVMNLVLVMFGNKVGLEDPWPVYICFISVAIWWAGFAQFTFRGLPEKRRNLSISRGYLKKGYLELAGVLEQVRKNEALTRYLTSYFVFNMGVQTVMILAATFAAKEVMQLNAAGQLEPMSADKLIISILLIQLLAIPGSFFFSWFSSKHGNLKGLLLALFIWIGVCGGAYFVTLDTEFFVIAAVVGLIMGGIQSLSRSTYSKLLPNTVDHASYFSFYDVADKLGIVLGTFAYGFIFQLTGSMRNSIVAIVFFFVLGFILLLRVKKTPSLSGSLA